MMIGNKEEIRICSEDGYFEENSRHPLKCDRSIQLPPVHREHFSYTQFSKYVQTKFLIERQQRKTDLHQGQPVKSIDDYTDEVFKQELFQIYGKMDEASKKFRLIFENYKDERIEQVNKWIDYENQDSEKNIGIDGGYEFVDDEPQVLSISDVFSCDEVTAFENMSNRSKLEPFIIPRLSLTGEEILGQYGHEEKGLHSLTEFDPEINIKRMTIPEICDMNVGEMLAEKIVEIIKKYPTGITNTNFLIEFKKNHNYYPEPRNMSYSNLAEMMKDLGKHTILVQNLTRVDNFYYPMCLEGLVCTPKLMFWNIWHKIKIVLNIHRGIVKVSKALVYCQQLFGWGHLDFKAWGFETEVVFIKFLIIQWADHDILLLPETKFKPKGDVNVLYLVMMTANRKKYLDMNASKIRAKQPSLVQSRPSQHSQPQSSQPQAQVYQRHALDRQPKNDKPESYQYKISSNDSHWSQSQYNRAKAYEEEQGQVWGRPSQSDWPKMDQEETSGSEQSRSSQPFRFQKQLKEFEPESSESYGTNFRGKCGNINRTSRPRAPVASKSKTWSSLFKKN